MQAGAGGVDVAAEVKALGLARLDRLGDQTAGGERGERAAGPGEEAAPRALGRERVEGAAEALRRSTAPPARGSASLDTRLPASSRSRPPALGRRASTVSSWARLLKVPLASTVPSRSSAIANGLPGIPSSRQSSASACSPKLSTATIGSARERPDRGLERVADATARGDEHRQRQGRLRIEREARRQPGAAEQLRPLLGDLERPLRPESQAQHADLARQRQHRDREPGAGDQRHREPEPEPLVGGEVALGQRRERGERRGEQRVAGDRSPADGRTSAEAGARRPGAAAQDRADHGRGEDRPSAPRPATPPSRSRRSRRRRGRARSRSTATRRAPGSGARRSRRWPSRPGSSPGSPAWRRSPPPAPPRGSVAPQPRARGQPIATIRSIGTFARSAISGGTLTSTFISRSESRSFGSVIIFMYLQKAIRLASIRFACGAACCSG